MPTTLNDVPLAPQTLAQTQNPIRQNFISISTGFAVDHVAFNSIGAGQHNKVTFPVQPAPPVFGGLNGLWSEVYTVTTIPEIWLNSNNGNQYPMSASILSTVPAAVTNTPGWTYLPSGIVIKWGFATIGTLPTNVPTNAIGPTLGAAFTAMVTVSGSPPTRTVSMTNLQATFITLVSTAAATLVYWTVIGRE